VHLARLSGRAYCLQVVNAIGHPLPLAVCVAITALIGLAVNRA
jgi:hypothetical protein